MNGRFELAGTFGGFVFTVLGKRRMVLQTDGQTYLLRVPRLLRRQVIGTFRAGQILQVSGFADSDASGAVTRRSVARIAAGEHVYDIDAPRRAACTVSVCAKKNCWRSGGRDLMRGIKNEIANRGLEGTVDVEAVSCLDRCQMAPNVDTPWRQYRRLSEGDAAAIVAEVAERLTSTAS